MSGDLEFYCIFRDAMTDAGISFALTSGMACVEYGIQQNTKDTDWLIAPDSVELLREMLCRFERGLSGRNWRIGYRGLFGAPLDRDYLANGWTSHLAIWDTPDSVEHHLDFFVQPPRLSAGAALEGAAEAIAHRLVVAQMKKTNRDRDWPIAEALAYQELLSGNGEAVLHLRDPEALKDAWGLCSEDQRRILLARRPLLAQIANPSPKILRLLAAERGLWEEVNKLRYGRYQHEWKAFLKRWRAEDEFAWPVSVPFARQHELVVRAADVHRLARDPLGGLDGRVAIFEEAMNHITSIFALDPMEQKLVAPPISEMLP